jgi:hypothetical protein
MTLLTNIRVVTCFIINRVYFSRMTYIYIYIYMYPCCSNLELTTSVNRFFSLQFLNLRYSVGLLGQGISPTQAHYLRMTTQTQKKRGKRSMP